MEETDHDGRSRPTADPTDLAVRGAAHDTNQLLGVILARVQLLQERAAAGDERYQLDAVARAARDAAAIVAGLLDGRPAGDPGVTAPAALADVVQESWDAVTVAAGAAGRSGDRLAADIAPDLVTAVPAYRLRQVIANLLANALDAMPDGGTVHVSARRHAARIQLTIADEGPGLTAQECSAVFLPGYTRGKARGHGIGLSHSRHLIEAAGGRLTAQPTPGEGATFHIELPAAAGRPPAVQEGPKRHQTDGSDRSLTILAVDDEAPVRELLSDILANDGHRVTLAAGGEEALSLFVPGRFDLVLVDYALVGLTGLDVARAVKRSDSGTRVALITGWGNEQARAAADPGLVDCWETKPLDLPKIRRLLARVDRRRNDA